MVFYGKCYPKSLDLSPSLALIHLDGRQRIALFRPLTKHHHDVFQAPVRSCRGWMSAGEGEWDQRPCNRNLNWRYLPYIRPIFQAYVRGYTPKIWPYMVQYLHFRILKFPLMRWRLGCDFGVRSTPSLARSSLEKLWKSWRFWIDPASSSTYLGDFMCNNGVVQKTIDMGTLNWRIPKLGCTSSVQPGILPVGKRPSTGTGP